MSRKKKKDAVAATTRANRNDDSSNEAAPQSAAPSSNGAWRRSVFLFSLLGAVLFFFSFSPHGWAGFGWLAPLPFVILVRQRQLQGRRPYIAIWLSASLAWLALLEGVRRPYWALYFGWFALSIYAAAYIPLFVFAARTLVHRWRWPIAVAAPLVWVGLELLRGYLFSGFSVGLLAHTQFQQPIVIQIADLFGQAGVSFLIIAPAAALVGLAPRSWFDGASTQTTPDTDEPLATRIIGVVAAAMLLIGALAYGTHRLRETDALAAQSDRLKVVLIQGNVDVIFGGDALDYIVRQWSQCIDLTDQARESHPDAALVVWPESCFSGRDFDLKVVPPLEPPPGHPESPETLKSRLERDFVDPFLEKCRRFADRFNAPLDEEDAEEPPRARFLVGTSTVELGPGPKETAYNSALFLDEEGNIERRYYKMHRVMFGEYIPIVDLFPILYRFTPLPAAIRPGEAPAPLPVRGWTFCPNICFESTVPHLIRSQARRLEAGGSPIDAVVNVTNDGWFWGSGVQDLHLHCAIFRAVELRKPFLTAANSGFAVHCDAAGRIQAIGKRRNAEYLVANVARDGRRSLYYQWGDLPLSIAAWITLFALAQQGAIALQNRLKRRRMRLAASLTRRR